MAISLLTDSERRVFNEVIKNAGETTQRHIDAFLKKSRVVEITSETLDAIEKLRKEIDADRRRSNVPYEGTDRRKKGSGGVLWAWAKKVLSFASSEANKIRIDE